MSRTHERVEALGVSGEATTRGRPRLEIVAELLAHVALGNSVAAVLGHRCACCANRIGPPRSEDWPSLATLWRWLADEPDCAKLYDKALSARADAFADEIADIADEEPPKVATQFGSHMDAAFVQWQRNRIDARKWTASRLLPKRYGDRLTHVGDPDQPIAVTDPRTALLRAAIPDAPAPGTSEPNRRAND